MNGYTQIFNDAESIFYTKQNSLDDKEYLFKTFRSQRDIYSFIDNGDTPPDSEAIQYSIQLNPEMYTYYLNQLEGRKKLGYTSETQFDSYNHLDSRHILMSIVLYSNIKNDELKSIVEIGGGYGNFLYLNRNREFQNWKIIDIPHLLLLQNYMLKELNVNCPYELISAYDYSEKDFSELDLVIGTHSLSEFSIDIFKNYFYKVIINSKYLLYVYHISLPSKQLIESKKEIIEEYFSLLFSITTENNSVITALYKKK